MHNIWKKRLLSTIVGLTIVFVSVCGTFHLQKNLTNAISMMKNALLSPSIAVLELNDFIKEMSSEESTGKTAPADNSGKKKNMFNVLFFMLSIVVVSNEKEFFLMMILAFVGLYIHIKRNFNRNYRILDPPELKFYLWWSLKFLTPVQKCIQNLAAKYDINPIFMSGRVRNALKKPALLLRTPKCGFFLCINP